ncbi:hypothetical protein R1flu_003124 [Riccia fluitans]|uniref:Uncharacterized protein n=1 Tax=Riccia fluitans TaxID=41844 RepID=A0ABD1Y839_9MARC
MRRVERRGGFVIVEDGGGELAVVEVLDAASCDGGRSGSKAKGAELAEGAEELSGGDGSMLPSELKLSGGESAVGSLVTFLALVGAWAKTIQP